MHNSPATPNKEPPFRQYLEVTAPLHSPATDQKAHITPRTSNFNPSSQNGSLFAPKTSPITPEDKMMHPSNCMTTPGPKRGPLFPNCLMNRGTQSNASSSYKVTKFTPVECLNHNISSQPKQEKWQKKLFSSPDQQDSFASPTHSTASTKKSTQIHSLPGSALPRSSFTSPSPKLINFKKCNSEVKIPNFEAAIVEEQEEFPSLPPTADQTQFQTIKGGQLNAEMKLPPKAPYLQNLNQSLFQHEDKEAIHSNSGYCGTFQNLNLLKEASFGIPSSRDSCAETPTFLHQSIGELARVINTTKIQSPGAPPCAQMDTSSTSSFHSMPNSSRNQIKTQQKIESPEVRDARLSSFCEDKRQQAPNLKSSTFEYKNNIFPPKGFEQQFQNYIPQSSPQFLKQQLQPKTTCNQIFRSSILGQSTPKPPISQFAPQNSPDVLPFYGSGSNKNSAEKSEYSQLVPLEGMKIQIMSPSQIQEQEEYEHEMPKIARRESLVSAWRAGDKSLAQFKSGLTPYRPKNVLKGTKKQLFKGSDDQEQDEEEDECHRDSIDESSDDFDKQYDDEQINKRYLTVYQNSGKKNSPKKLKKIQQCIECNEVKNVVQNPHIILHSNPGPQNSSWHSQTVNKLLSPETSMCNPSILPMNNEKATFPMNLFQRQNSNELQILTKPYKVFIKQSSFPNQGASSYDGHPLSGKVTLRPQIPNRGGNRVASSFNPQNGAQKNPYAITTPYGQRKEKRVNRSLGGSSLPCQGNTTSLENIIANTTISQSQLVVNKFSLKSSLDSQKSDERDKQPLNTDKIFCSKFNNSEEQDQNSSTSSLCDQQQAFTPSNTEQGDGQQINHFTSKLLSTPPKKGIRIDSVLDTPEPMKVKEFIQPFTIEPQPFDTQINKSTRKMKPPRMFSEQIVANEKDMVNISSPQRMDVQMNNEISEYNQKLEVQKNYFCSDEEDIDQNNSEQKSLGYNKFFLNIPERFDHDFKMIKVLGNGSFGTVLKCQSRLDRLLYAVKKRTIKVKSRNRMKEVLNEIYALAATSTCEKNQNIVKYFNGWFEDGNLFIVMELCRKSLQTVAETYRKKNKIMSQKKILKIMREVTLGLNGLHEKEIVHLDIKPLSYGGVYKIGDLGLAKLVSKQAQDREVSQGDSRYMAKQLLNDWYLNDLPDLRKADIFSLGAMMYELMSGVALESNGEDWQQLRNGSPNIDALVERGYSVQMCSWIKRMLHPDTKQRPFCDELLEKFLLSELEMKYKESQERVKELELQVERLRQQIIINSQKDQRTQEQSKWCFQKPTRSLFQKSKGLQGKNMFEDNEELSRQIDI